MGNTAPLILVVGMHRSGTSLLCSLLQAVGVAFPGQLIVADRHNPEGYFEWQAVVDLQERLLIDLERWWPSAQGALALPDAWLDHPATVATKRQLHVLLSQQFGCQIGPWAIKDPRTSRLLPLWMELAIELHLPLRVLLAVRDPAEVARSLIQRDGPITGMDLARAQQLWWRHNLEALDALAPEQARAVVDFGAWFSDPETQLNRVLALVPELEPSSMQRSNALAVIRPEHRRSLEAAATLSLDPKVRRLHRQLLESKVPRWLAPDPPRRLCPVPEERPQVGDWTSLLEQWRHYPAPRYPGVAELAPKAVLSFCGLSHHAWTTHLWIERLPIPSLVRCALANEGQDPHNLPLSGTAYNGLHRLAINRELPPPERVSHWLDHLCTQEAIWDPDPARVLLMRRLGLPAYWLDPQAPVNGWLHQPGASEPDRWGELLGLSTPVDQAVVVLGPAGSEWDRILADEAARPTPLGGVPPIAYFPGWPELIVHDGPTALAQAGWLVAAASCSKALVWSGAMPDSACAALPVPQIQVQTPITPAELRAAVAGESQRALAQDRATPSLEHLFSWEAPLDQSAQPVAAVLVSLFNYSERITTALESVANQCQHGLELIVVDDASTDHGSTEVLAWMRSIQAVGDHPFVRLQLLRHRQNVGLATARNTAFALSRAAWCFVLDADNALFPEAVSECLKLALAGSARLAVVHPLLAVEVDDGRSDDLRTLVSTASWQQQRLSTGNVVDAMALIRRDAWQAVGGYTHIEGGWEDFDFWCKLIETGYYGVQCPQILAVYRSHSKSMSHTATNRGWRALSRTLQARHPWLKLPLAEEGDVL